MGEFEEKLNKFLEERDNENLILFLESLDKNHIQLKDTILLKSLLEYNDFLVKFKTTELIAECAKTEKNRIILSEKELIQLLLAYIKAGNAIWHAIRALGNIFYENEDATKLLDKSDLEVILEVFYNLEEEKDVLLLSKVTALLLNIFISNGDLQFVNKNQLLSHISLILENHSTSNANNITLNSYLLQIVYTLMVEYEDEIIYSEHLHKLIINILKNSNIPELELLCLQIFFHTSDKKENVPLLLAKSNVCEKIFELVEKYKSLIDDEESRSILKMACDLINNILTEDESMKLLYDGGKGKFYLNCIQWLDSKDEDLLSAAIMAIGNFARNDENSIGIVKSGISKKLIGLLSEYSTNFNFVVLISLLGALKNLAISKINKRIILEEGLIPSIEPLLKIDDDVVKFKLLGTLRIAIDGQETAAMHLISKNLFVETLLRWYNSTHYPGLKLEVPRLLAWLIKNCFRSYESMHSILRHDGLVVCLVSMISSGDVKMENEAFLSLLFLLISLKENRCGDYYLEETELKKIGADFVKQIVNADIATVLPYIQIFSNEPLTENLILLLEKLFEYEAILEHFKEKNAFNTLRENSQIITSKDCLEKLQKLISTYSS